MKYASRTVAIRLAPCAVALLWLLPLDALAQPPGEGGGYSAPVYQRNAHAHGDKHHQRRWDNRRHFTPQIVSPPVSSSWYQRPYPYHLDYYKMRYGGSYAPYFGNLYGTPQVVTAPPYFGPYYGNFEPGAQTGNAPFGGYPAAPNSGGFESPFGEGVPPMQAAPPAGDLPAPR